MVKRRSGLAARALRSTPADALACAICPGTAGRAWERSPDAGFRVERGRRRISAARGVSREKPPQIVVDSRAGVGTKSRLPMSTFYNLPASGERVPCSRTSWCARTRIFSTASARMRSRRSDSAVPENQRCRRRGIALTCFRPEWRRRIDRSAWRSQDRGGWSRFPVSAGKPPRPAARGEGRLGPKR